MVRLNEKCVSISLQCGRQIAQLKEDYEESKKTLVEEASKLRQVSVDAVCALWNAAPCFYSELEHKCSQSNNYAVLFCPVSIPVKAPLFIKQPLSTVNI